MPEEKPQSLHSWYLLIQNPDYVKEWEWSRPRQLPEVPPPLGMRVPCSSCLPHHSLLPALLPSSSDVSLLSIATITQSLLHLHAATRALSFPTRRKAVRFLKVLQKKSDSRCLFLPLASGKVPPTQLFSPFLWLNEHVAVPRGTSSYFSS